MSALPNAPFGYGGPTWLPQGNTFGMPPMGNGAAGGINPLLQMILGQTQQAQPQQAGPAPDMLGGATPNFSTGYKVKEGFKGVGQGLAGLMMNPDLAMAMLANSGYSPNKKGFGEILGTSMLQARGMQEKRQEDDLLRQYREAQIQQMQQPGGGNQPSSVQEYEYAKQNGYKGSFEDWSVRAGQTSRPSSVQEWEFYNALPEDQKQLYLEMKRNPNFRIETVNKAPTAVVGLPGGRFSATPLSTTESEAKAAGTVKLSEAEGGAVGKGLGEITAGIQTKGSNAKSTIATLDLAEPLIDAATGSAVGAGRDKLAAVFGEAPQGAQAIAQLRVLQANLMTSMPRMEGPQSDRDVELYRQAAGQIGDPMIPADIKKAAVKTIRALQQKYVERANEQKPGGQGNVVDWSQLK